MPYFDYSKYNTTTSPLSNPSVAPLGPFTVNITNSINYTATVRGFRDFLLKKNIGGAVLTGTTYNNIKSANGGPSIGEPVLDTSINDNKNRKPANSPVSVSGIEYKNLKNIVFNKYKNTNIVQYNQSVDIQAISPLIPIFGPATYSLGVSQYPSNPDTYNTLQYGLLAKTTYKKYKENSTLNNLYDVTTEHVDMGAYIDNPYTTTAYYEANSSIVKNEGYLTQFGVINQGDKGLTNTANIIGSLGGLGISQTGAKTGLVTNNNVRSSLVGRVLGATGNIKDTKIGTIGATQLVLALANNAAFNVQQEILGKLNIQDNILSLIKGDGLAGFRPNYQITVPSSGVGRLLNDTASILGFTLPRSFISDAGSIFASENGNNENIARANALIVTTGKGQLKSLIQNVNSSLFGTGGYDSPTSEPFRSGYAPSYRNRRGKKQIEGDNIYAYSNGDGNLTNPLESCDGIIPDISFSREQRTETSGFKDADKEGYGPRGGKDYSKSTLKQVGFTWTSDVGDAVNSISTNSILKGDKKSLLVKTQKLFNSVGMLNMIVGKGDLNIEPSQIQTTNGGGMSKGSGVLKGNLFTEQGVYNGNNDTAEKTYARAWTTLDRYDKVSKLIRHSGLYDKKDVPYRHQIQGSVLDDNGFVKITPYVNVVEDPKKFMFSIENLAWNDQYYNLLPCERGSGDLLTGKKGRIMWFPPYDIQFSENSSVEWDSNKFIGRGESVYTYSNTERSGTLSFKVVVDHPTYVNAFSDNRGGNGSSPDDNYVASFFAGEIDPSASFSKKMTSYELDEVLTTYEPDSESKLTIDAQKPKDTINLYFPNDVYSYYEDYENGDGKGIGHIAGQATSTRNYNDNTDFGLNTENEFDKILYTSFTETATAIAKYLALPDNAAVIINVKGSASIPGQNTANDSLASKRANTAIDILKSALKTENVTNIDKRIKKIENTLEEKGCDAGEADQSAEPCKRARNAIVEFGFDYNLFPNKEGFTSTRTTTRTTTVNPIYGECTFFEKLKQTDDFIFDKFREKIKYFHPAFHSTTPEGLNSRLTFLLQCTRQGPTLEKQGANNLAFGRPPVCILRIGDFYNTKIVIDSISFDYEPLVWDLNPEGIGVQPMIANVNMSFKFIGGSTLLGPINKLQNALSFNYFANTHVYDVRADYLSKVENPADKKGKQPTSDYQIHNEAFEKHKNNLNDYVTVSEPKTLSDEPVVNQIKKGDAETNGKQETKDSDKSPKITGMKKIDITKLSNTDVSRVYGLSNTDAANLNKISEYRYNIKLKVKTENIFEITPSGGENNLITIDEITAFVGKGIKIKIESTDIKHPFIYESIINSFDNDKWNNGFEALASEIRFDYEMGNKVFDQYATTLPATTLKLTVMYNNEPLASEMIDLVGGKNFSKLY